MTSLWEHEDFKKRGIKREIAEARPYDRWTLENVEPVRRAYRDLDRHQRAYMTRLARKRPAFEAEYERKYGEIDPVIYGGWVINRNPPPNMRLKQVCAEIRPDAMIETGPPIEHVHKDGCLYVLSVDPKVFVPDANMTAHINRARAPDDHRGENDLGAHWHKDAAKYIFPPTRKCEVAWHHDHGQRYEGLPEKLERHLQDYVHDSENVYGEHEHVSIRKDRDPDQRLAQRLDLHPDALEKFADEYVYFVLEGCFKADSVLSAGGAVFSVPSVTLWRAPELARFARRYLRGKTVVIVCDADWSENPRVVAEATSCMDALGRLPGVDAIRAAPPLELYKMDHDIKGVDDFLGSGGKLTELEVINFDLKIDPRETLAGRGWYRPRVDRAAKVLESMALHADREGRLSATVRGLARIMDLDKSKVSRTIKDLRDYGDIRVHGDLETNKGRWTGGPEWARPTPIIELVTVRAVQYTWTLGELMGRGERESELAA